MNPELPAVGYVVHRGTLPTSADSRLLGLPKSDALGDRSTRSMYKRARFYAQRAVDPVKIGDARRGMCSLLSRQRCRRRRQF